MRPDLVEQLQVPGDLLGELGSVRDLALATCFLNLVS
jgi:hypothetical protein